MTLVIRDFADFPSQNVSNRESYCIRNNLHNHEPYLPSRSQVFMS